MTFLEENFLIVIMDSYVVRKYQKEMKFPLYFIQTICFQKSDPKHFTIYIYLILDVFITINNWQLATKNKHQEVIS